jgi:ribonuclease Z
LQRYQYKNYLFHGISEGGIQTAVAMPQFHLSFDIGRGASFLTEIPKLLLTHGHLDHSSGLAYYVSQRSLRKLPPPEIYCPPEIEDPLRKILSLWSEIEQFDLKYSLIGVDIGKIYPLHGNYHFRAIKTVHRVASNAYTILEKSIKLKGEFANLPGHRIAEMKRRGDDLFFESHNPIVTFSGDTCIEFVLENEEARKSKILFMECTYVDEKRAIERARNWGHTHLFEIAENAEAFRNVERLFLIHFSPRYTPAAIHEAINRHLPAWLSSKTTPFLTLNQRRDTPIQKIGS